MNDRKSAILSAIIKEHINTGQTVASKAVVDNYGFSLSPATIRNEMMDLEKEGYIHQPHTSAGRVPTEKGWKFYIENFLKDIDLPKKHKNFLKDVLKVSGLSYESMIKDVAKNLAELSKDAVFVGFSSDNFYYTGLTNLFRQPEFHKLDLVCQVSSVVDHLDEVIKNMFNEVAGSDETKIFVGSENPFGKECGSILSRYQYGQKESGVFGILGPMRMNYENNLALIKYARNLLANA